MADKLTPAQRDASHDEARDEAIAALRKMLTRTQNGPGDVVALAHAIAELTEKAVAGSWACIVTPGQGEPDAACDGAVTKNEHFRSTGVAPAGDEPASAPAKPSRKHDAG